eukprot:jgi/Ulvmu1/4800/UM020_0085.1
MSRVYVGNLPVDVRERELDDVFSRYGTISSVDIKGGREGTTRFAFLEFEDPRDAEDAVRREDGADMGGARMRVEIARGGRDRFDDHRSRDRFDDDYRGRRYDDRGDDRRRGLGPSPFGPSRKTDWSVQVSGLEPSMSWQDLKDHFRSYKLEVTHADVDRRGYGTAMFASQADAEDAVKLVDGSDMKNMRGSCVVRVDPERGQERDTRRRSRSRSP